MVPFFAFVSSDTSIKVSEDTKAKNGTKPPSKDKKTIAEMQFEIIAKNPYTYTSDEVLFQVYADRKDLAHDEYHEARAEFFSKGQPCMRASALTKTYGFGVHSDELGRIAIYGVETEEYQHFLADPNITKVKAMKSAR